GGWTVRGPEMAAGEAARSCQRRPRRFCSRVRVGPRGSGAVEQLREQVDTIGDDTIHALDQQILHGPRLVDRPHVHLAAGPVSGGVVSLGVAVLTSVPIL